MQKIFLTKNKYAIVDDADFSWLSKFKWQISGNNTYAVRTENKKIIRMHRLIMDCPNDKFIDHINGNKLDNRRENLRICIKAQNEVNKSKRKGNYTSKFKGVVYVIGRRQKHWMARVSKIFVGYFNSEIEAAQAYNIKARELYKDFIKLNPV